MAGNLNPLIFQKVQSIFRDRCIKLLIDAYFTSISDESVLPNFDENDITAILYSYIDNNPIRKNWKISANTENHLFDNTTVPKKGFAAEFSRIDMRFTSFWNELECKYYVEAKNLKEKDSALKRRYITTGIDNFLVGGKYEKCNGLLVGFILEGTSENCVLGINNLLKKNKRQDSLISTTKIHNLDLYTSSYNGKTLPHLFFDYCN